MEVTSDLGLWECHSLALSRVSRAWKHSRFVFPYLLMADHMYPLLTHSMHMEAEGGFCRGRTLLSIGWDSWAVLHNLLSRSLDLAEIELFLGVFLKGLACMDSCAGTRSPWRVKLCTEFFRALCFHHIPGRICHSWKRTSLILEKEMEDTRLIHSCSSRLLTNWNLWSINYSPEAKELWANHLSLWEIWILQTPIRDYWKPAWIPGDHSVRSNQTVWHLKLWLWECWNFT